ncbi:hypothetical protein RD110_05445 [Rhodoferax koreense]|uniref:Uncharacterized protein n=1 Tax=Rhodoferax koreensis TaxID=1842727 RepID=A0A1P8K3B5_9BURK|nr:transporter substrate-binding domain-containing protein [Rhodoferax koreense]APW40488.1 hypothetical protein RD110_05445 [Rhodoferax koreense]
MKSALLILLTGIAALSPIAASAESVRAVTEASPYVTLQGNQVAGPATEVLEKTLATAGIKDFKVNIYPWARAYDMALSEPNVLIYLIARTPEREKQFHWVGEFIQVRYFLYRLKERADIAVQNLDAARNYVIGVMRDDTRHQYLTRQGFSRLVVSAQVAENFAQLLNRKVDMVPLSENGASTQCRQANFDCASLEKVLPLEELNTGLYMAYSLSTPPELVARTKAAFEQLRGNGTVRRIMEARTVAPNGK